MTDKHITNKCSRTGLRPAADLGVMSQGVSSVMAKKEILSVGFELAGNDVEYCPFDSDISLLDWDIILFTPRIGSFLEYADVYNGKLSLSDSKSFKLKERSEHWRREIEDAVLAGKTVIVFLSDLTEVFIATGEKRYSGTGRNQKTTRIVAEYNNYKCIPANVSPVKRKGSSIKLSPKGAELVAPYWSEFGELSEYKIVLEGKKLTPSLLTKHGDNSVGAIIKPSSGNGAMFLLPDIDFYPDDFFEEVDVGDGEVENHWSNKALQFSSRLVKTVVSINVALVHDADYTPEPDWATSDDFTLKAEDKLRVSLLSVESKIEVLLDKKSSLLNELDQAGRLRGLLYEGGKALEAAILDALKIIGFKADNYEDENSEFDAVFSSKEGRLIGEAEGKDNKAINVTKLRQLSLNIFEDLERETVETPAKGVLFGNAFRLKPLSEREEPFTNKCITAAQTSSTALVFTPDLFMVARYLSNNKNAAFAKKCRLAIANTTGRVTFPDLPEKEQVEIET